MIKYYKIYKYHSVYGKLEGFKRVLSIFKELDVFDFKRRVNTRSTKTTPLTNKEYMYYVPVFYSVALEMLRVSAEYYKSAIQISDSERKTVFVDLGAGAGKTLIIANEINRFDLIVGIDIDQELVTAAIKNTKAISNNKIQMICGNVETANCISEFQQILTDRLCVPSQTTLFVFNKNSYGPNVLRNSVLLLEKKYDSIVYLYQNPVHHDVLINLGFTCFSQDNKPLKANKNYKYKLYIKENYNR